MAGRPKTRAKREAAAKAETAKKPVRKKTASKKAPSKKAPAKKAASKAAPSRVSRGRPAKKKPEKSSAIPSFVTSYTELARFLGVSRQSLNRWTKLDGAPKPRSDGRHVIADWKTFMKSNDLSGKSHDLNDLKARDLLAKIEEREFKNAVKRGEYVSVEEVRLSWSSNTAKALQMLEKALCDELPPILAGLEPIEIRQKNEQQLNEVRRLLHSGEGLTP
jgi:hypothetical protein